MNYVLLIIISLPVLCVFCSENSPHNFIEMLKSNERASEDYWIKADLQALDICSELKLIIENNENAVSLENVNVKRFLLRYLILDRLKLQVTFSKFVFETSILNSVSFFLELITGSNESLKKETHNEQMLCKVFLFYYNNLFSVLRELQRLAKSQLNGLSYEELYRILVKFLRSNNLDPTTLNVVSLEQVIPFVNAIHKVYFENHQDKLKSELYIKATLQSLDNVKIAVLVAWTAIGEFPTNEMIFQSLLAIKDKKKHIFLDGLCEGSKPPGKEVVADRIIQFLKTRCYDITAKYETTSNEFYESIAVFPSEFKFELFKSVFSECDCQMINWWFTTFGIPFTTTVFLVELSKVHPNKALNIFKFFSKPFPDYKIEFIRALLGKHPEPIGSAILKACEYIPKPLRLSYVKPKRTLQECTLTQPALLKDIIRYCVFKYADSITRVYCAPLICKAFSTLNIWHFIKWDVSFRNRFIRDLIKKGELILGIIKTRAIASEFFLRIRVFKATRGQVLDANDNMTKLRVNHDTCIWDLLLEAFGGLTIRKRPKAFWSPGQKEETLRYFWKHIHNFRSEFDFIISLLTNNNCTLYSSDFIGKKILNFVFNLVSTRKCSVLRRLREYLCVDEAYGQPLMINSIVEGIANTCLISRRAPKKWIEFNRLHEGLLDRAFSRVILFELTGKIGQELRSCEEKDRILMQLIDIIKLGNCVDEMSRFCLWPTILEIRPPHPNASTVLLLIGHAAMNNKSVQDDLINYQAMDNVILALDYVYEELVPNAIFAAKALIKDNRNYYRLFRNKGGIGNLKAIEAMGYPAEVIAAIDDLYQCLIERYGNAKRFSKL